LEEAAVTVVAMEATGDYWKPFFFLLDETLNVELVNAKQAKNIPGRKTDVSAESVKAGETDSVRRSV
jgi:transposase